ncbi:hypothetical protein SAMN04487958_107204 [Vreelandella subterranea]|uniref:Phage tail assembly chaperone n=1 Tax=Vreelandella subterranea TaxID=416874 RepID=A0A1H9UU40_9GAMM|nr:hypothetical protein [Halomonas subterranea]SES12587.1 hypothetical protein SAMN04487958_107204 [Halomonas subterranea]
MTFKLKPIPDVSLSVLINVPGDRGKSTQHTITVRYRLLSVTEQREIFDASPEDRPNDDDLMARDVIDIEGIKDEDGKVLPYDIELLSQLMDISYVREPIINGWLRAQAGAGEAKQKN